MKIFTNKKVWQKIVLVMLILLLMQFFIGKPAHAIDGDVLLEPITSLFANLGDGIMNIMQQTIMGMDSSGTWVEKSDTSFWIKFAIIAGAIVAAVVSVVAIALSGGTAIVIITSAVGAVLKIAGGAAIAYFAVSVVHFGESGFFLPEYELTPQTIFKNEVLAFDVNFFNPKESKKSKKTHFEYVAVQLNGDKAKAEGQGYKKLGSIEGVYYLDSKQYDDFCKQYGFDSSKAQLVQGEKDASANTLTFTWENNGKNYKMCKISANAAVNDDHSAYVALAEGKLVEDSEKIEISSAKTLQPTVAKWYKTFRNIAIVALLSILVYVGIRITLSSISSDKAKYKQMLMDWVVALCLVFLMHYIMAFAVTINEKIIKAVSSISGSSAEDKIKAVEAAKDDVLNATTGGKDSTEMTTSGVAPGVELFIVKKSGDSDDTVKRAYKTLVGDDSDITDETKKEGYASKKDSTFYNRFVFGDGEDKDPTALIWPTNDYMTQARIKGQQRSVDKDGKENKTDSQMAVTRAGYNVIYVVLVIYTIIFCFTYLKRVIYMAFLTIIAPLVAITYPIDKMNDGKAQAFDMWFKEYLFNLLIQPMHLILYTVLIGAAMDFASQNIFYVVVALGFFMPAEKLLRRFFGFEKAQTPPMFGGPAMSAVMMSGINKLMHKPPKGGLGPGSKGSELEGEDEGGKLPFMNKSNESAKDLFGSANGGDGRGLIGSENDDSTKNNILGNNLSKDKLGYDSRLSKSQIDELKAEGIGPGDQEYDMYLRNMGLNPNNSKNNNNSNLNPVNKNGNTPKFNKTPITSGATVRTNAVPKKRSLKRAVRAGLINKGDKYKRKYFGKNWRNLTNAQAAAMVGKKAAGLGAKAALAYAGATAAGIASITGGNMEKGASNMIAAGVGGYALGKGISNKINSIDHKSDIDAMREAYYGDEYKAVQQKEAEKKFAKDEENLKKIEQKLKVDREKAKEIAKEMATYTDKEGINDVDTTLAIYQMQQEGWDLEDARYAASYNNVAFDGKNTNYMKEKDREDYKNSFKSKLMSKDGVKENDANVKANNLFRAMDRFNELKS